MKKIRIGFKKLHKDAVLPSYSREGDACMDIRATEEVLIPAGERRLVKTGLAVELPKGYKLSVKPRSGLALNHGLTVLNTPGTVDGNYKGEIGVVIINTSKGYYTVEVGERIAQIEIEEVLEVETFEIDELTESNRGDEGFGSSGRL